MSNWEKLSDEEKLVFTKEQFKMVKHMDLFPITTGTVEWLIQQVEKVCRYEKALKWINVDGGLILDGKECSEIAKEVLI